MLGAVYEIHKIRDRYSDKIHEREVRRKGHRVNIFHLEMNQFMYWTYIDGSGITRTSEVKSFSNSADGATLTVTTKNSVYTFKKIA